MADKNTAAGGSEYVSKVLIPAGHVYGAEFRKALY